MINNNFENVKTQILEDFFLLEKSKNDLLTENLFEGIEIDFAKSLNKKQNKKYQTLKNIKEIKNIYESSQLIGFIFENLDKYKNLIEKE